MKGLQLLARASDLQDTEAQLLLGQFYDKGVDGSLYVFQFLDFDCCTFIFCVEKQIGIKLLIIMKNTFVYEKQRQLMNHLMHDMIL